MAGFVGANVAGDAFTAQTFEEIGLGNGCEMVDDEGEVTFDSPECVEALDFYGELHAGLLGRPVPRTSTPRGRPTSPARPR